MIGLDSESGMQKRMWLRMFLWFAVGIALVSIPLPAYAAPVQEAAQPVPSVSLAELGGTPGATLMMPLYFSPDPKTPLRSVAVDIEYTSNNLIFMKASRGLAGDQVNADIQTSVTEGAPDDRGLKRAKLNVTAAVPGPSPKEGLPDGLLAYLLFQISLDAKPFSIKLTPTVVSAEDLSTPAKKVASVGAEPGMVMVEVLDVMPEGTCFFFTH